MRKNTANTALPARCQDTEGHHVANRGNASDEEKEEAGSGRSILDAAVEWWKKQGHCRRKVGKKCIRVRIPL
jgi:hypothetical protein